MLINTSFNSLPADFNPVYCVLNINTQNKIAGEQKYSN